MQQWQRLSKMKESQVISWHSRDIPVKHLLLLYQEYSQFRLNPFMPQGKRRICYDWTRDTPRPLYGQKTPQNTSGVYCEFPNRTLITNSGRVSSAVGVCTWMRKKSPSTARENRSKLVRCIVRTETDMVLHLSEASGDQWSTVAGLNPWSTSCLDLKGHRMVLLCILHHQEDKSSLKKLKRYAMIRNWYNQIPHPALKTKREITKYINWRQFTKGTRGKLNGQLFPK